jgi:ABC-type multidrug transport system ATPase subunit
MSESILNALMHLFAIVATISTKGVSEYGRSIVKTYLLQHIKEDVADEYLKLFEDYLDFYKRDKEFQDDGQLPSTSIYGSQYLAKVCSQIRKELHRNERIIVLLRLIEYVYEDQKISDLEREFIRLVAETFNISNTEMNNAVVFIEGGREDELDPEFVLSIGPEQASSIEELEGDWIDQNRPKPVRQEKKIVRNKLRGEIIVLHFSSVNIFIFKYTGSDQLLLDSHPVTSNKFYLFDTGSSLRNNEISPVYYSDIASIFYKPESEIKIVLNADNVEFKFRSSDNGIHDFSFSEESGHLIGIMGGSGVGKSTLLNLLSGQLVPDHGTVTLNDYDVHKDRFKLKDVIGFVPQDDLLFEELTVFQNLYYNAKLCFGDFSEEQLQNVVRKTLTDLDLLDIRDLKVGNPLDRYISGGQRKRLNIGLELMREPSVLFIDEPTSGLSSHDSENVMRLLKEQTIKGKLVVANIHQPSSNVFKMLDKLWVLDKGGYPIYAGNPVDAIVYFKKLSSFADASEAECSSCGFVNPDQILQIIETRTVDEQGRYTLERKIKPEEWYTQYKQNIEPDLERVTPKKILPRNQFKIPDIDKQFFIFFIRNLLSKFTNRQYILINLLEAPILAFILSYFIKYIETDNYLFSANKNIPTYLFMAVIVALFQGLVVSAEEIIKDKKILKRESFLNLSRFSYLNSKILYLFGVSTIQTFLFVIIGNAILEIKGMTFIFWLILFSTACFGNMVGLNISAGLNTVVSIYILIPLILIPQLLLSGVPVKFDDLHKSLTSKIYVPVIGDIMTSRWAYEAMAVELFKNNRFEKNFYQSDQAVSESTYKTSFLIPRLLTITEECERNLENPVSEEKMNKDLQILHRELEILGSDPNLFPFEYIDNLNVNYFDEDIAEETLDYLTYLRFAYQEDAREATQKRDSIYQVLVDSIGEEGLFSLKQDNHNEQLSDILTNRNEINKIIQIKDRLIQKKDPVFMIPESNVGRAHFYAPFKKFNDQLYDTKWFNLMVIWIFSFILYVLLLLDVFRKINDYFTNLRLHKQA